MLCRILMILTRMDGKSGPGWSRYDVHRQRAVWMGLCLCRWTGMHLFVCLLKSNTTGLIEQTIQAVKSGSHIVEETAEALKSSVDVTNQTIKLINDIWAASAEQAAMIEQVNTGVDQISSVVQTNSATAEQSAASSEELNSQATALQDLTSKFVLKKR